MMKKPGKKAGDRRNVPQFFHHSLPHISNPYFGIGRYVRTMDSSLRLWLNRAAADRSNCGHRNHRTSHSADTESKLESSMTESPTNAVTNAVQIEQKSYEMPPREGISIAQFLTVADIERSARYYEKVFGARILTLGDGNAPAYLLLANIWMILNVGAGRPRISRR